MKIRLVVIAGLILLSSCSSCSKQKTPGLIKFERSQLSKIVDLEEIEDVNEDRTPRIFEEVDFEEAETTTARPKGIPFCNV